MKFILLFIILFIILLTILGCYLSFYSSQSIKFNYGKNIKLEMGKPIYNNDIQCITKDQIPTDINNGELFKVYNDFEDLRSFNTSISKPNHKKGLGPNNIFIIRHAERIPSLYYLDKNGIYRSTILPNIINVINKKGFPIDFIVSCNPNIKTNSIHVQQTITLASWIMNIPLFIFGGQKDIEEVTENLYTIDPFNGKNVLMVWEHTCIQSLLKALIEKGVKVKKLTNYKFGNPLGNSKLPYWHENNYNSILHLDNNLGFHVWNQGVKVCTKTNNYLTFGKKQTCKDLNDPQ